MDCCIGNRARDQLDSKFNIPSEFKKECTKMAIWDFRPRGDLLTGVAVGIGALAAPVVIPWAWSAVRPMLKALLKGGFLLYETGRGAYAEAAHPTEAPGLRKAPPIKVKLAERPGTEADHQGPVSAIKKATEVDERGGLGHLSKPATEKPKRKAKTGKKKAEKEN